MLAVDESDVQVAAVGLEPGSLEGLGFCGHILVPTSIIQSGDVHFCLLLGHCCYSFIAAFITSVASAQGLNTRREADERVQH